MNKISIKLILFILITSTVHCASKTKKTTAASTPTYPPAVIKPLKPVTKAVPTPNGYTLPTLQALTNIGDNNHPHFNSDGTHILFDSQNRPTHQQSQIYEFVLASMTARRVTFQDGNATHPSYLPSGEGFIYASNTDELKEDPQFLSQIMEHYKSDLKPKTNPHPAVRELPTQEIYMSHMDGSFIRRLTNSPGFDGRPNVHPHKMQVVFTSDRGGKLELFELRGVRFYLSKLSHGAAPVDEAQFSWDGKQLAWIEYTNDFKSSKIYIGSETAAQGLPIELPPALYHDVSWSPDGHSLIFSANLSDAKNPEIYNYDLATKCLRRLTYDEGVDSSPAFSPDGKQLVFASNRSGSFQLYMMEFKPPKDCL